MSFLVNDEKFIEKGRGRRKQREKRIIKKTWNAIKKEHKYENSFNNRCNGFYRC